MAHTSPHRRPQPSGGGGGLAALLSNDGSTLLSKLCAVHLTLGLLFRVSRLWVKGGRRYGGEHYKVAQHPQAESRERGGGGRLGERWSAVFLEEDTLLTSCLLF